MEKKGWRGKRRRKRKMKGRKKRGEILTQSTFTSSYFQPHPYCQTKARQRKKTVPIL